MAYERYVVSCVHGARLLNSLGWLIVCVWMVGIGWKRVYSLPTCPPKTRRSNELLLRKAHSRNSKHFATGLFQTER